MIYQGLVGLSKTNGLWIIWLICAMFGSALTLASFLKVIHAVFLGQASAATSRVKEVSWLMWAPMAALALICVVFGIFAYPIPLARFIVPSVPDVSYSGIWSPVLATGLILMGLLLGVLIYWFGRTSNVTVKQPYIGGESLEEGQVKVSGAEFYDTIRQWGKLDAVYKAAEKKMFDIYELGSSLFFFAYRFFSWLHNGYLDTYLAWMLLGAAALIYFLR